MAAFTDWAQNYLDEGYAVIPLKKHDRTPFDSGHDQYSIELPTQEKLDKWTNNFKDASLGLVCGKASNIVAVDYDYTGPYNSILEEYVKGVIPPSPCIKFGSKGWTAFYRYGGFGSRSFQRNFKDRNIDASQRFIDILSDGKYTVLPPSFHEKNNKSYVWLTPDGLLDISNPELPVLTASMVSMLESIAALDIDATDRFFALGGRHDKVVAYAFAIMESVADLNELAIRMIDYDKKVHRADPYFEDKKYLKNKTAQDYALNLAKRCVRSIVAAKKKRGIDWEIGATSSPVGRFKPGKFGYYMEAEVEVKGEVVKKYIPQYLPMALDLMDQRQHLFSSTGYYKYTGVKWDAIDSAYMGNMILNYNIDKLNPAHIDNFKKMIHASCYKGAFNFKDTAMKINLKNGIFNITTGKLEPHSADYFFQYCLNTSFDASARCDRWLEFLNFVFEGDQELIDVSQRMFGYTLMGGEPFLHLAFVLHGGGRNGKSTFIKVLREIIGAGNYSTVSLAKIDKEFSAVMLDGSLANIVEETPTDKINAEAFKTAVAGGELTMARKGFDEYSGKVNARFIFACNDMPVFKDSSAGLIERLLFIPFGRFISLEERDTGMDKKLYAELSGIFNWAIEGAKMVIADPVIRAPGASVEIKEEYREESDSVYNFFISHIEIDDEYKGVFLKELYGKYKEYCLEDGQYQLCKLRFSKRIRNCFVSQKNQSGYKCAQIRIGNQTGKGFKGLRYFN